MSKDINIKDKNRSKNKVVVGIFIALLVLFILIRVVALQNAGSEGITVIQPDLDSVNLENNTSKMAKFEREHEEELAKENNYTSNDPQPSNYNFKEMFGVDGKTTTATAVQTQTVAEAKPANKSGYGHYEPVQNNSRNEITEEQIRNINKSKVKQQEAPVNNTTPVEPEPQVTNSSPFGTYSSNKTKSNTSTNTNVKTKDAYKCFLHSDQKIVNGGGCIFRAGEDIVLEDRVIKRNSILYGSATYQGQRVLIKINRVKSPDGEYAVNLTVYDNDFVKGIFFKNAYDEVAEKTTDDMANDGVEINPGLVKTATKAVVHAGKNVGDAIKKERSLHLQEGYIIYIKDNNNENR